jgi:trehalose/maltose hydrolase-like predicted phosphorylase
MGYLASGEKSGWPLFSPRYDGAFVAGLYAQDPQTAENRQAYAALPTWSTLMVSAGGDTYTPTTPGGRVSRFRQTLFLRCGLLRTTLTWTNERGQSTDLAYDVIAHREHEHVGAVHVTVSPHWSGTATVTDLIDGAGARRMSQTGGGARTGDPTMDVTFRTDTTGTAGAVASMLKAGKGVRHPSTVPGGGARNLSVRQAVTFPVHSGRSYEFTKYVGVDTALTSPNPEKYAVSASREAAAEGWDRLLARQTAAWDRLWRSDIVIPGHQDLQAWLRSGTYGLLSSTREGQDNSIAPTGLSSDNYAGLVFWDAEIWMYPGLLLQHPEVARSVVDYRYKTLGGARANARKLGYQGVFFPWTSGSKGDLWSECHSWKPPHCVTQIHLQGDIALATWQYYLATKDVRWLRTRGWPVLKGIAEYFAGRVTTNGDGSYSLKNIAGPDEYSNGVTDGVYTNAGAATALRNAADAARAMGVRAPKEWTAVAAGLRMPFDRQHQVFSQYDGYTGSRIKQADTVLLMYPLEWPMSKETAGRTLDYYAQRTDPDGPAMTDSVHAIDAAAGGEPGCSTYTYLRRSIEPFIRTPFGQFSEARGEKAGADDPLAGSPAFDFLTGVGGYLQVFTNGLTGLRWRADRVHLDPMLPPQLSEGVMLRNLRWQGRTFDIAIGPKTTVVTETAGAPFTVESPQGSRTVGMGRPLSLPTRRPDLAPTDNAARCKEAKADSEDAGVFAEAAVDGSLGTAWTPDGPRGTLTVTLARPTLISRVQPDWTDTRPSSFRFETSLDGRHWSPVTIADAGSGRLTRPARARYVRAIVQGQNDTARPGIRELRVIPAGVPLL